MLIDYPLGHSINGSPHSVCVSLPTMRDVIGYEEHDERVRGALLAGYPRFITHPLIGVLEGVLLGNLGHAGPALPVASAKAAEALIAYAGGGELRAFAGVNFVLLSAGQGSIRERARAFLQHTGVGLSSREAEAVLVKLGKVACAFQEQRADPGTAGAVVRAHLHRCYGTHSPDDIYLARGGMNAFFGGFRALQKIQAARGRDLWIQLGWLYVDTIRVLEKMNARGPAPVVFDRVDDLDGLRALLEAKGQRVAGIVTEVPTNPLLHTADVGALRDVATRCGCALILDPTIVSPHNVNVLPYADLHINSLTKYACREGDAMVGAAALNADSPFYAELKALIEGELEPPSPPDLARLAFQIDGYADFVETVNHTSLHVVDFLQSHPKVRDVWWARQPGHATRFDRISHKAQGIGGVLSFAAKKPLESVYDRMRLAKSPSFGTVFSMACPFLYLAHYELASNPPGRARLAEAGIPHDLIRLSIGKEHPDEITGMLSEALT